MEDETETPHLRIGLLLLILVGLTVFVAPFQNYSSPDVVWLPALSGAERLRSQVETYLFSHINDTALVVEIADAVMVEAAKEQVPPGLTVSIMAYESNFVPTAVSSAGARGLMQVMPLHVPMEQCQITSVAELFDPAKNICAGVQIWLQKLERCEDRTRCAFLAYNGCLVTDEPFRTCYSYPERVEQRVLDFLMEDSS
jgi:hypothetical protein